MGRWCIFDSAEKEWPGLRLRGETFGDGGELMKDGARMGADISVHDHFVYAYGVDCGGRRVVLHMVYPGAERFVDVVFREVAAHWFEYARADSILFDVEEVDVEALVQEHAGVFEKSWRYGWPQMPYSGDLKVLVERLRAGGVRGYEVSASLGLSGWVLAKSCERVTREAAARVG